MWTTWPQAAFALDQPAGERLGDQERAFQVGVKYRVPVRLRHLQDGVARIDPSTADQGVEATQRLPGTIHRRFHSSTVANVHREG